MGEDVGQGGLAPGPRGLEALRWLRALRKDPVTGLQALSRRYGDVARIPLPRNRHAHSLVLVSHPDGVRHVLQENHTGYRKADTYDLLALLLGDGLLTSEGEQWRRHRRLAQPAFHRRAVESFADMMREETEALTERWERRPPGTAVDVAEEMRELTLLIVGRALFSRELAGLVAPIGRALDATLTYARGRFRSLLGPYVQPPSPSLWRVKRAGADLDREIFAMIAERRRSLATRAEGGARDDDGRDLLDALILAGDEPAGAESGDPDGDPQGAPSHDRDAALTDDEIRDEVVTFLMAGHETTAHALAWAWHALARNAHVRERLEEELDRELGGKPARLEDLDRLPYTAAVIDETLRLYPPVWVVERTPLVDDEIAGYHVPVGSVVMVSEMVTHRHAAIWDSPLAFWPERFLHRDPPHRFAYFPFGAGPRQCIGAAFALLEARLILATMAQRFRIEAIPGFPVVPEPVITLRPAHGIRMVPRMRHSGSAERGSAPR